MAKKGEKMVKPHKCTCIYCGEEFNSVRPNAKFHKNSCKVNYHNEKDTFIAESEQKFIVKIEKLIEPYSMDEIKRISEMISKNGGDGMDLGHILMLLKKKATDIEKEEEKNHEIFLKKLKEKWKHKK